MDIRTVMVMGFIESVICTMILISLRREGRGRFSGIEFWALDIGLVAVAQILVGLRGIIPDWLSIGFTTPVASAAALFGLFGLGRFVGQKIPILLNTAVWSAAVLVNSYFAFVQQDIAFRNFLFSFILSFFCLQSALVLFRSADTMLRPITRNVGIVYLLFTFVNGVRIVHYFTNADPTQDYFQLGNFQVMVSVAYQVLLLMLTFGLVMMVNKRLVLSLRMQEHRFAKAFHTSPYAIVITRMADGEIIDINPGFETITGYTAIDVIGKRTEELQLWANPGDRSAVVEQLRIPGMVRNTERQFRRKNGEELTGLFSADMFVMNNETYILSSINDITERKLLETERERLVQELQDALASIKTMSGLIPICASCKKIRDDRGFWNQLEQYLTDHSEATFSHGICPECLQREYPEIHKKRSL
jgi:PAS domain S-box-containing protein